jgi:5-methylcytosine-specific restriction endonuclease McrA
MTKPKTYREMVSHTEFEDRYTYLRLGGSVGASTFGFDRYINQAFYRSREWRSVRDQVIIRDEGCDLGVPGYEIHGALLVHHMNPIVADDIVHNDASIFDLNQLITTTTATHNAIHYGDRTLLRKPHVPRMPGDTKLW